MKRLIPLFIFFLFSCKSRIPKGLDFKEEMRSFVIGLSSWAKAENPNFVIIPQNGIELLTQDGEENSVGHVTIDAQGQEDFLYGYYRDNPIKEVHQTK